MLNELDISKIKELISDKDVEMTNEERTELLSKFLEDNSGGYGLKFINSVEDVERNTYPYIKNKFIYIEDIPDKEIVKGTECVNNYLIEGDNLEALKVLKETHKNKIDIIYIDPPYNTGNKDFVYNDSFISNDDGFKHSKWLSFMEKRLKLAYKLLSNEGVMFISIDDNEQANLKLLCDRIFGASNFIADMIWENKYTVSNDKINGITTQHEHILCYSKKEFIAKPRELREDYVNKSYIYDDNDGKGKYRIVPLYKKKNPKSYTIINPEGVEFDYPWNYSESSMQELIAENKVYWGKNANSIPSKKVYLSESKGRGYGSLLLGEDVGYSSTGGSDFVNLGFNKNLFSYPKPTRLIKYLINMHPNENATILDFFAGSGTTGNAVLDLNKEDGGNRKFILCTNNENNICEEVTYKRLSKVIQGYTTPKGVSFDGIPSNLSYFKVTNIELDEYNYEIDFIPYILLKENARYISCDSFEYCVSPDKYVFIADCDEDIENIKKFLRNKSNEEFVIYTDNEGIKNKYPEYKLLYRTVKMEDLKNISTKE